MNPVRLGITLAVIGAILIVATIGVFVLFFYGQDISTDVNDWGAFGSYLGGVLGVSISSLALLGAVIAIYQQHITNGRVNDHVIASDLMRSIERLEDDIDNALQKITIGVHKNEDNLHIETDAFRVLTGFAIPDVIVERLIPRHSNDNEVLVKTIMGENRSDNDKYKQIELHETFATTCGKLRLMRDLLLKHKVLAGHNVTAIYYKGKYKHAVKRLRHAGYPIEAWDDMNELHETPTTPTTRPQSP